VIRVAARLVLESARHGEGPEADRIGDAARAVEILGDAMRLHAELLDSSAARDREGEPVPAGLGGAWLLGQAAETIASCGDEAAALWARTAHDLVRAHMLEIEDLYDAGRSPARYLAVAQMRAGSLLALATSLGALMARTAEPVAAAFREYGLQLGIATEIATDIVAIGGANGRQPQARQLGCGNYTLPVLYALESDPELAGSLGKPLEPEALPPLVERIRASGGIERAQAELERRVRAAEEALGELPADGLVAIASEVEGAR